MMPCHAMPVEPVETQDKEDTGNSEKKKKKRFASSWDAKAADAVEGSKADYLSNLGSAQDYNINVTHGAVPPDTALRSSAWDHL